MGPVSWSSPASRLPSGASSSPPSTLLGPFVDTFRVVRPHESPAGTFTGFKYGNIEGEKIDYILAQPGTEVMHAEIVRFARSERYPSDHFPVAATIRLPVK